MKTCSNVKSFVARHTDAVITNASRYDTHALKLTVKIVINLPCRFATQAIVGLARVHLQGTQLF
jgi:predicted nucleotidyltransferase